MNNMSFRRAFVLVLAATWGGCKSSPAPDVRRSQRAGVPPRTTLDASPSPIARVDAGSPIERLRAFRSRVQLERSAYEATSQNRGSYESAIRKIRNQFEWTGTMVRIPGIPMTTELARDLKTALTELGVVEVDVVATERQIQRPAIPETVPEGEPWRFEDDDVRGVVDVRVTGKGVLGELSRKVLDLFHRFTRLLAVVSYSDAGGRLEATLTAFYFRPVRAPTMVPRERDADKDLHAAGIDVASVSADPDVKALVLDVKADYAAMKKVFAAYRDALALTNEVQLSNAKLRFFKGLVMPPSKSGDKGTGSQRR
ncbi:MAG: hypothetical protein HYY84_07625 [Deltaproteobacteria bacterium]|nr:hypothetical protein [Deltaproteobacteria bacterium]